MDNKLKVFLEEHDFENVESIEDGNWTPLHVAAYKGYTDICEVMIQLMSSESINAVTDNGATALHLAAQEKHKEICKLLIPKTTFESINAIDIYGCTTLYYSGQRGLEEIFSTLLPLMTDKSLNTISKCDEMTPLIQAAHGNCSYEIGEYIISKLTLKNINNVDIYGDTALHGAVYHKNEMLCKLLLSKMTENINIANRKGKTPLGMAYDKGYTEIAEMIEKRLKGKDV